MINNIFNFDSLALICSSLIIYICAIVAIYSKNYLKGDRNQKTFFILLSILTISLGATFSSNNIFIFSFFWVLSNAILVLMMIHKSSWKQAVNSGILAAKNFAIGAFCLTLAALILYYQTNSYLISEIIVSDKISKELLIISTALIAISALSQSAVYPFHSWLISSLNSPTPTSAIMHAGLINGGGILLTRFSDLIFQVPQIMTIIFVLGIFSALVGTLWKLIQSNVKAMLACSTMSQMGFMIAQCGLGLFPAAIAHLFWHGMFKSYLFLSSPSSWQEKRLDFKYPPQVSSFCVALICGAVGACFFAQITQVQFYRMQTDLFLVAVAFIGSSQLALTIIDRAIIKRFIPALILSIFITSLYASSVVFIENIMPKTAFHLQAINAYHAFAIMLMFGAWIMRLFLYNEKNSCNKLCALIYVKLLNASQPKIQTITSNRNNYKI